MIEIRYEVPEVRAQLSISGIVSHVALPYSISLLKMMLSSCVCRAEWMHKNDSDECMVE